MLITNRLLTNSNVADAFLMPIMLQFFLAIYIIWTQERANRYVPITICFSAGLALATRIHNAAPILLAALAILPVRIGFKKTILLGIGALGCWYVFTPIIWITPLAYIRYSIIGEVIYTVHTSAIIHPAALVQTSLLDVGFASPLMIIGILLALGWVYSNKEHPFIPKGYIALLLICTAASLSLLQISHIESLRYYFPLIILWECFVFPLAMPLITWLEDRYALQKYRLITVCIVLSITGNALMLFTRI